MRSTSIRIRKHPKGHWADPLSSFIALLLTRYYLNALIAACEPMKV